MSELDYLYMTVIESLSNGDLCMESNIKVNLNTVLANLPSEQSIQLINNTTVQSKFENIHRIISLLKDIDRIVTGTKYLYDNTVESLQTNLIDLEAERRKLECRQKKLLNELTTGLASAVESFNQDYYHVNQEHLRQSQFYELPLTPIAQPEPYQGVSLAGDLDELDLENFPMMMDNNFGLGDFEFNKIDPIVFEEAVNTFEMNEEELVTKFIQCFPLPLPCIIKLKSFDDQSIIELYVVAENVESKDYYVRLKQAGFYIDPVVFSTIGAAFRSLSRLLSHNKCDKQQLSAAASRLRSKIQFDFPVYPQRIITDERLSMAVIVKHIYPVLADLSSENVPSLFETTKAENVVELKKCVKSEWPEHWMHIIGSRFSK